MSDPDVDHIIAVHDLRRPIGRAVGSVLRGTRCDVRVSVVCHNIAQDDVATALGDHADDDRVRLMQVDDGIRSPSGPFNSGLDAATGRFTSIMGSDDELAPGAIDAWLQIAERTGSDVVIADVKAAHGGHAFTPPVRVGRRHRLDGVRDRLAYRAAPLGLVSRVRFGSLRFPGGLASGEDVEYVAQLWYSSARIAFAAGAPAYVVHDDAPERVSTRRKPVSTDAAFLHRLLESPVFASLSSTQRDALMTKILRGNVLQWIAARNADMWEEGDVAALADAVRRCESVAPHGFAALSRTDRDILDCFTSSSPNVERALSLVAMRTAIRPRNLVPRSVIRSLAREAPLRFGVASTLRGRGL